MTDVVVNDALTIPEAELRESFSRSSGPGGQNVNKVESRVELRWRPADSAVLDDPTRARLLAKLTLTADGDLLVTSSRTRDQIRNRADARAKMAERIRAALARPKPRKKTKPSRGAIERRLSAKREHSARKAGRQKPRHDD